MPKAEAEGQRLKRYHIHLDEEVAAWYRDTFGGELGFSRSIRHVMRSYKSMIEAQIAARDRGGRKLSDAEIEDITKGVLKDD